MLVLLMANRKHLIPDGASPPEIVVEFDGASPPEIVVEFDGASPPEIVVGAVDG